MEYSTRSSNKTALKRVARMVGAGVISAGMVGVFALPAYAAPQSQGQPDGFAQSTQTLQTSDFETASLPSTVAPAEVDASIAEEARLADEERAAAAARAEEQAAVASIDVPAGAGAQGLVSAALAQLGQAQDCTALVERALRAIGFSVGDLGTSVGDYAPYGTVVSAGSYAAGDILIYNGHVAIYIGNGQAVHGGWNGGTTAVAPAFGISVGNPIAVVRVG